MNRFFLFSYLCQSLLLARETERKPKWELLATQIVVGDEVMETGGDVVEQLIAGACHDVLGDRKDLGVHVELLVGTNVNKEDAKNIYESKRSIQHKFHLSSRYYYVNKKRRHLELLNIKLI